MLLTYNVMCKKIKHFLHSFTFSSRLISVNFLNVLANFPLHFLRRDAMTPIMQYIYLQGRAHENFLNQIFWVQSLSWQRLLRGVSSYFHRSFSPNSARGSNPGGLKRGVVAKGTIPESSYLLCMAIFVIINPIQEAFYMII